MTELLERINLLLEIHMITEEEYRDLKRLVGILVEHMDFPITDENAGVFITHLAAAMKRSRDNEKLDQLEQEILDEVKNCEEFTIVEKISSIMIDTMQITLVNNEVDFMHLHLCNILKTNKMRGEENENCNWRT